MQSKALQARTSQDLEDSGMEARIVPAVHPAGATSPTKLFSITGERAAASPAPKPGVVLVNERMRELYRLAERVAVGTINIVIRGETGAGKELLAHHIHQASLRAREPFVAVNCGALPETLLDSELFGHERGAFTGALQAKDGLLETASGGTLFLDEVGEMSPALQTKMLRALEAQQIVRVGGTRPRKIDIRVVAATNRDLEEDVEQGTFRQDLYFRLAGDTLVIPPLRDRVDEIEPLARAFLQAVSQQLGREVPTLELDALAVLRRYSWPGNIRELRNVMERAVLHSVDFRITPEQLPVEKMERAISRGSSRAAEGAAQWAVSPWRERKRALERQTIIDALERCAGNRARAAALLAIPRSTFFARLKALDIA
jgi:two-component system, NtrC family, response regulator AtoC